MLRRDGQIDALLGIASPEHAGSTSTTQRRTRGPIAPLQ